MKRVLSWALILILGVLILSCAPAAAPTPAPVGAPPKQDAKLAPAQSGAPSGAVAGAPVRTDAATGAPASAPTDANASGGEAASSDRMIINNAQISMEVKDTTDSLNAIGEIVNRQQGFVVNNNFHYEGERKVATVIIRVPVLAYESTLAELRRLAIKIESEDSKAQDVTEEYTDLQSQLRNLEATEAQYLELLKKAQSIDDILKVQARLTDIQGQIERIKGRTVYLERTTDMAAITISLFSRDGGVSGPQDQTGGWWKTPAEAFEQSLLFLTKVATAVLIAISFFWWLLILIGAAYVTWRITSSRTVQPLPLKKEGD